jgi:DNA-binding CsgD family transcriptional regulator
VARTVFVGRHGERVRLASVLRGEPGSAGAVLVTGDAGIGKTRLIREVAGAVPEVAVLAGSCLPLSESLPYGAITDALDGLTGPSGRPVLDKALSRCAPFVEPQICALIPALSDQTQGSPHPTADRTRLFTAFRDLLAALGADRRTALVVEDLHWADPGTLDLLTFLVRGQRSGGVLVATSRRAELPAGSPVLDWLDTTSRLPNVEPVTLGPLPDDDVASLVASLLDSDPAGSFVAEVGRRGQGNPFFTEQLVAAARDVAPPLEVPAGVPPSVAAMLLGRIRSVSAAGAEVAAVLALAARPLAEPELAACVGTSLDAADGLRELLDSHLAEVAEQDRYQLRHALLADTVRGTMLASQRVLVHAQVAGVLADRGVEAPAEVAAHWSRAGHRVEEVRWSVAAARHAEGLFAWREASTSWRRAWELWADLPDDERPNVELTEIVMGCVADANRADDNDTFMRLARDALADERVTMNDQMTGELLHLYGNRLALADVAAGVSVLERAVGLFERTGRPSAAHARTLLRLVTAKTFHNSVAAGTEEAELARAAAIAEQVGDLDLLAEVAIGNAVSLLAAGQVDEGVAQLTTAQQQARDGGATDGDLWTSGNLVAVHIWLLRLEEAIDIGSRSVERARRHGATETFAFAMLVSNTVHCLLLTGDVAAAEELMAPFPSPGATNAGWPLSMARAELDLLAGGLASSVTRAEEIDAMRYHYIGMQASVAMVGATAQLWQGRPGIAWERIERVWTIVRDSSVAAYAGRMLALAARAAADLAGAEPQADREQVARELLERARQSGCFAPHPARVLGAAYGTTFAAELARLARTGEEPAWRAAQDTWAGHGVPHQAAYAGWRLAVCLLDRGRRNDGHSELVAAYAAAKQHEPLRREIEALARRARLMLGDDPQMPNSPTAAGAAPSGLTSRELDVLRLLGSGATNDQIARQLYISPKTASVHVTHIYRKIGVHGRFQAAMVAQQMGLLTTDSDDGA